MAIERVPVTSSTVASVGYDPDEQTMAVEFKGGDVYHYHDVDKDSYNNLLAAKSIGSHLHANIKGKFKHAKQ